MEYAIPINTVQNELGTECLGVSWRGTLNAQRCDKNLSFLILLALTSEY